MAEVEMSEKIEPAMSADCWAVAAPLSRQSLYDATGQALACFFRSEHDHFVLARSTDERLAAVAALALNALPDGHPLKITGADVSDLETLARGLDGVEPPVPRLAEFTRALAAKLRALLPPEGA